MARLRRSGCGTKRFEDDRDGARIAQIEHRRCDISVAARSTPPKLRQERHHRGLGVLLAVSRSTEMARLRGLGCGTKRFEDDRDFRPYGACGVFGGTPSTEMARLRRSGCGTKRFEDDRDFRPYGAWGVFGWDAFHRTPHESPQIEHRRCDISVAARSTPPKLRQERHRRGLGVLLAVSRSTEMARLRRSGCGTKRFEEHRDFGPTGLGVFVGRTGSTEISPLRGLGCCWPCRVLQRCRPYRA